MNYEQLREFISSKMRLSHIYQPLLIKSLIEAGGTISSSPAVVDTIIYVGSEDGRLYSLDITTGDKLWDILTGGKIISSPAVADGMVYVGSCDGNLYAVK